MELSYWFKQATKEALFRCKQFKHELKEVKSITYCRTSAIFMMTYKNSKGDLHNEQIKLWI